MESRTLYPGGKCLPAMFSWKELWIILVLLLAFIPEIVAQSFSGYHFASPRKRWIKIPFELHANLIVVPIQINASDTLRFILDTGVSITLVTDPDVAKELNLAYARQVKIAGAGEGGDLTASVALGNTIRLGAVKADGQTILALSEDVLSLSDYIGVPIHGIFGYDIFKRFVVTIDFRYKEITLMLPERHKYTRREGTRIPISIEETKPYLEAMAILDDNQEVPIKVIIDTGAGHALSLDINSNESIRLPDKVVRAQLGRGLSGVINGNLGRLEGLKIGGFVLDNVVTSFPDPASFGLKTASDIGRQGNVGCELLRRFTVTFNYTDKYMALKPIKSRLKESFEHDMSGLALRAHGKEYRNFFIDRVEEDSPASIAGLMSGDEIVFVNNLPANKMMLSDLYKILQKKEGREVRLLVKRNNELIYTSFILKRII